MNHLTINVHLDGSSLPRVQLGKRSAHVTLGDWQAETVIYATSPAHLKAVAEAFDDAARRLSDEFDRQAATPVNAATGSKAETAAHYAKQAAQASAIQHIDIDVLA